MRVITIHASNQHSLQIHISTKKEEDPNARARTHAFVIYTDQNGEEEKKGKEKDFLEMERRENILMLSHLFKILRHAGNCLCERFHFIHF